jgi:hypothetical protein
VGFILLAGLLARIPFYLAFRPVWSGDSPGYSLFYYLWRHHVFYLGERTPVYPLFLGAAQWLAGGPPEPFLSQRAAYAAILMQSALDVLAAVLFYFTLRALRIRGSIALGASIFLATIPAVCGYEMNILNMSLAFFSLVLVISFFVSTVQRLRTGKDIGIAARATGTALAVAVLNRPDLLIFAVLLLLITACLSLKPRLPGSVSKFSAGPLGAAAWMALPLVSGLFVWMLLMGFEGHAADGIKFVRNGSTFVRNNSIAAITNAAANAESPLLTLMYVVTLGYVIFFFLRAILSGERGDHWLTDVTVATLAVASVGTIVGTCVLAGLNRVYSLPHLVVFTICTAYALENLSRIVSVFRRARSLRTPVSANVGTV